MISHRSMPGVEKLSKAAGLNALGQRRHVAKWGNLGSFNWFVCGNCIHAGKTLQGLGVVFSSCDLVTPILSCLYQ